MRRSPSAHTGGWWEWKGRPPLWKPVWPSLCEFRHEFTTRPRNSSLQHPLKGNSTVSAPGLTRMLEAALFTEARDWKRMNGAQCGVHHGRVPPRPEGRGVSPGSGSTPLGDRRRRETPQRVIPLGEMSNVQNGPIHSERRSGVA